MSFRQFLRQHGSHLGATAAMALALASGTTPALAVPLAVGTDISVAWDRPVTGEPDLNATLDLTVESMTSSQIVLGVDIANTTSPLFPSAQLTAIGWQSSPLATRASDTSAIYGAFPNQNFPTHSSLNLCLSSGAVCAGGSAGLSPSQADLSTLTLDGSFAGAAIDFSNFAAEFQTNIDTFNPIGWITGICTSNCSGGAGGGAGIPEPSSLSIFGVAMLAGFGYLMTRSRAPQPALAVA
jgi:hypothetical protein